MERVVLMPSYLYYGIQEERSKETFLSCGRSFPPSRISLLLGVKDTI